MADEKNKKQQQQLELPEKGIHRSFQIGALLLVLYIIYNLYFTEATPDQGIIDNNEAKTMSDQELNERVKAAIDKATEQPEYKQVKDFVTYVEGNIQDPESKILKAKGGILIFVPENKLGQKDIKVSNDQLNISISSEKLPETGTPVPAEPVNSGTEPAK